MKSFGKYFLNCENWEMLVEGVDSSHVRKGVEGMLFACGGLNGSRCIGRMAK